MAELPRINEFLALFRTYAWDSFHAAFGYPPDNYRSGFPWIVDLENRFREALARGEMPSVRLVAEMVMWGGNQRGVLSGFARGLRSSGDYETRILRVIDNLDEPKLALKSALGFPRFGLTYASKLLRFLRPSEYGALDSRIRGYLEGIIPRIYDGNEQSMWKGYQSFLELLRSLKRELEQTGIARPGYGDRPESHQWHIAEIEMALYSYTW